MVLKNSQKINLQNENTFLDPFYFLSLKLFYLAKKRAEKRTLLACHDIKKEQKKSR